MRNNKQTINYNKQQQATFNNNKQQSITYQQINKNQQETHIYDRIH